eukprot:IDg3257t1
MAARFCRIEIDRDIQRSIQSSNMMEAFNSLVEASASVFIVRIRQDSTVDHAVVVDAGKCAIIGS